MHLSLFDMAVVIIYAVSVLAVAQYLQRGKARFSDGPEEYAPLPRALPWWAIGTSLIAANISAEQIIGMSGSAYALGIAIAAYELLAALALLIVGKFFLPIYLKNNISTMPEFLKRRYGTPTQVVMAVFWLGIYVLVALTSTIWLGAMAVHTVTGLTLVSSLILLGLFAGNYALYVGLRAAAFTDVLQVSMLVLGGLVIAVFALDKISAAHGGAGGLDGLLAGFAILTKELPEHFHLILEPGNPYYKYVPGLSVLLGGMWVINLSYWGFNQFIVQRALAAKSIREVQSGVVLAAFLKLLMPVLVVLPGIAAAVLVPHLERPDQAYPNLMTLLPNGFRGFVFVALVAAIIASMGSTLSSIATIFTNDVYKVFRPTASKRLLVIVGYVAAIAALLVAMATAVPLLRGWDQAFQYIQEFNGFFTPGIVVIFVLGMFWKRATQAGALTAAIGSALLSTLCRVFLPQIPFMNRIGFVFLICLGLAVVVSLMQRQRPELSTIEARGIDYSTSTTYNVASAGVIAILAALYYFLW
ncbi:MAG: sodium/solute symporter [Alphaproteobacteria bacterium]|nr:sodium/solute symporter [Alphaproteobacteria bacterium]